MNYDKKHQYMLVANDEKVTWDAQGKIHFSAPGRDTVAIYDIGSNPAFPERVATLAIENSLFGPPTNLSVTPDNTLALIANPMTWNNVDETWQPGPGHQLHVIDLAATPPSLFETIDVGHQPSGLSISPDGTLALIANRADQSISVLSITGKKVQLIDTVEVDGHPVAVVFSRDSTRAFFAKMDAHAIGILKLSGNKVHYDRSDDIPTGLVPYNLVASPDGKLLLVVDMGHANASDGHADTISVIDIEAHPPRLTDKMIVGDAPEGLVMSPTGRHAAAIVIQGSNCAHDAWFYHHHGKVVLMKIDGKRVSVTSEIPVGALPEGAVFSPDGNTLYVGNFLDGDMAILEIRGDRLHDTGRRVPLDGHPAAMRSQSL